MSAAKLIGHGHENKLPDDSEENSQENWTRGSLSERSAEWEKSGELVPFIF